MASFWPRLNTVLLLITLLAVIGLFATRALGGPLDPTGTPSSTDGVRGPGTPISSLPFSTTEGGYYYVTRPLSAAAGQSGITICCSNTTINLGGFTITGAGVGMNPGDGISNPGARNIVIRNGAVRGWTTGINLGGTYSRVERVQALSNLAHGILVGPGSEVRECKASLSGGAGIQATSAVVRNCTVWENQTGIIATDSSLVEGNQVHANTIAGIAFSGSRNMAIGNQLSGNVGTDVVIGNGATFTVLTGNVYCTGQDFGTNTSAGVGNWC